MNLVINCSFIVYSLSVTDLPCCVDAPCNIDTTRTSDPIPMLIGVIADITTAVFELSDLNRIDTLYTLCLTVTLVRNVLLPLSQASCAHYC